MADFLFKKAEMSQNDVDTLMRLWTTSNGHAPFLKHHNMLSMIDAINFQDVQWQSFSTKYSGDVPPVNLPDWMLKEYTVHFHDLLSIVRNMISNPDCKGQFDYAPYREFEDGTRPGQMLCLVIGCGSRQYDLYIFLQCLSTHYL